MRLLFPCLTLRPLLTFFFIVISSTLSAQQLQIQVNQKRQDPKSCIDLKKLKTITLSDTTGVRVTVSLARGKMEWGTKSFHSVQEFNQFNMKAWLNQENRPKGKAKVRPGDRLVILLKKEESEQTPVSTLFYFCEP